jgi:cell fate regulator YaaT (PSP1 superfamily)
MADVHNLNTLRSSEPSKDMPSQHSVEEARAHARERFEERLDRGEKIGGSCGDDEPRSSDGDATSAVGVRFRDSSQVYFFESRDADLDVGAWVIAPASRGLEPARVVIAPRQMLLSQPKRELKAIDRALDAADIDRIDHYKRESSRAIERVGEIARARGIRIKPVAAEYSFDGADLTISFSAAGRIDVEALRRLLEDAFDNQVLLQQVGPRDEGRLLGGLGRCGRTLSYSSWLPMYPDVSMNTVEDQERSLNPTKVSDVGDRLRCFLSDENEQYRRAKAILPRLGQIVSTPAGEGMVVSLQISEELVTVRLRDEGRDDVYPAAEIFAGAGRRPYVPPPDEPSMPAAGMANEDDAQES